MDIESRKKIFFERVAQKFGDRFDLSSVEYINDKTKVRIKCDVHGWFDISPCNFLKSPCGCPKCSTKHGGSLRSMTKEGFITKSRSVHGDKYDYSKVEYVDKETDVCIVCPKHGEFFQKPVYHLMGYGCQKCGLESRSSSQSKGLEKFLEDAKAIHGDLYDYSKVEYINAMTKVCIICPTHGEFWQEPHNHLKGCGCPYCVNKFKKTDDFIRQASFIHQGKYSYEKSVYVNAHTKIEITCPQHGSFWQTPFNHLHGHGCPKCVSPISKWEKEVFEFVQSLGIECEQSNRKILEGFEIDIFIPSMAIGIECDGLRWHSELYKAKGYHLKKSEECSAKGIRLIHIFEDEWLFKRDIVESMLRNLFGKTETKIYARKCVVREVVPKDKREFLAKNHIQGDAQSSINIGLYYNDELVAMMTFGKPRINIGGGGTDCEYELVRFCNKLNTSVVGGASKLFKWFTEAYGANSVVSYSDKRWSLGNMYAKLGFTHTHDSAPNYFYIDGYSRLNRFGFRKSVLVKEGYDASKSEHEIMFERGMYRIYDCGTMVWKWSR